MEYFETAAMVVLAAKELTEQEQYYFFYEKEELSEILDKAYRICPDMELDAETCGYLKETLRTVANAVQIVRSACLEIESR